MRITAESPFVPSAVVDERIPMTAKTRQRREREGLFPKRIQISTRVSVYRAVEIAAWEADPEQWAAENRARNAESV